MKKFDTFRTVLFTLLLLVGLTTVGWGQTPDTVLSENFDGFSHNSISSPGSSNKGGELNDFTQQPGWSGDKIYEAGGSIKLSSSSSLGWIQTPSINLSANSGNFTLRFKSMAWSGDSTTIKIYVINPNDTTMYLVTGLPNDASYTFAQFQMDLTGGTANTMIQFSGNQAAKGRFFLEDFAVIQLSALVPSLAITVPAEGQTFLVTDTLHAMMDIQNFIPGVDGYVKLDAAFLYPLVGSTTMYCGATEIAMLSMFPIQLPAGDYTITATLVGMDSAALTPDVSVTRNFSFVAPVPELTIVSPTEGQRINVSDNLNAVLDIQNFAPGVDGYVKLEAAFLVGFVGTSTMYCDSAMLAMMSVTPISLPEGNYSITASLVGMDSLALDPVVSVTRNFSFFNIYDPTITPGTGTYYYPVDVTLACPTNGVDLRYTIDGTTPTDSSLHYPVWNGTIDTSWYVSGQTSFDLSTPEQLAGIAVLVNSGITTFSGVTINLTSDIWLNNNESTTNNWVPIGGKATASGEEDGNTLFFQGILNGNNHTIYNLYCDKTNYFQSGFFGAIKGSVTVQNVIFRNPVIKSKGMMGVVAGYVDDGSVYIKNCMVVNATVIGANTTNNIGCIYGASYSNASATYVQNCGITGSISGNYAGGIAGNGQGLVATNCYFAGTVTPGTANPNNYGGMTAYNGTSFTNCYSNIVAGSSGQSGTVMTNAAMQDAAFVTTLGNTVFKADCGLNNGYPILIDMTCGSYSAPITIDSTCTLNVIAFNSSNSQSNMVSATYTFPEAVNVSNIAAFKAANTATNTTLYKITGDVTFVYRTGRYIFVQDTTGGLVVYDNYSPVITNEYVEGDVISGGIYGTYTLYNGLSEMIPFINTSVATINNGTVDPMVVSIEDLTNNYTIYETRLVKVAGVTFDSPGYTFTGNANTNFTQGISQMVMRNHFGNLNGYKLPGEMQSITGFLITYNTTRQLAPREESDIIPEPATLPYSCDFETTTNNANWTLVNGELTNKWYFGQAQGFDNNKLFISSNNGTTNKYNANENAINVAHAYRDVEISELGGLLSFDYRVMGEICTPQCDYLQVSLLPVNTQLVAGTIPSSYLVQLNGSNDWNNYSTVLPAGIYRLVFTWVNDQYTGEQYPAAVDNIVINAATCATPSNIVAAINATLGVVNANISWTIAGSQTNWLLEYKLTNHTEWYAVNVTGTPVATLTNLQPNSTYDIRVKALCGDENSQYAASNFTTPCVNSIISSLPYRIGTGSSLTGTYPTYTYYKYSYSQEIFLASEVTASGIPASTGTINAVAYRYNYSTDQSRNIDLYMVNTTNSTFASTATTSWLSVNSENLVYSGIVNFTGTGTDNWVIINLTTPFQYTGNNIMIAMDDNTGTAGVSGSKFYYHTSAGSYVTMYYYNTTNNPDPSSMTYAASGRTSSINDIKFYANTVVCVDTIACPLPTNLAVNNVTANTAEVSWTPGSDETAWSLEYKLADATDWTVINANATHVPLTGLQRISNYVVRIKAICGNNNYSVYASSVAFTTLATCPTPANFVYNNAANMTTITWDADGQTEWVSQIKQNSQDDNSWTTVNIYNIPNATISGLVPNTLYNFRVKAICSADDQSAWGTFNFTSGCLPFDLPFVERFTTNSFPSCWTNVNNTWSFSSETARSSSLAPDNYIITPAISLPASGNVTINYDIATSIAANEHYDVMISFRGTNPENFISLYDETVNNTTLTNRSISIPAEYNGGNVYIAFVHNSAISSATLILDNVVVSACALAPTQLTASDITASSADLSWTVDASASQWVLEYSTDQSVWNTMNVSTNPYTLTGLTGYTSYYIRVKTICADGFESAYSNVLNITTLCSLYNIPFTENFDAYSSGVSYFPDCWTRLTNYTALRPYIYSNYSSTTPNSLYFYSTSTYYSYAVTPELNITNANDLLVKFKALKTSAAYGILDIGVMTDPNDISTFVTLGSLSSSDYTATSTWYDFEISLVSYVGTGKYIALRAPVTSSTNYVYVDNFEITHLPSCPKPTNLTLTNISENSASFSWVPGRSETNWTVEYKLSSESDWTVINNVNTNSYTISNLNSATSYSFNFRVKAVCSETDQSQYVERLFTFSTSCGTFSTLPFIEGFENGVPPTCWSQEYVSGTLSWISSSGGYSSYPSGAHGGSYNALLYTTSEYVTKLVTPEFDMSSYNNVLLSFWYAQRLWGSDQDILKVYYKNSPTGSWNLLATYTNSITSWTNEVITLPDLTSTYWIAFEGTATYGYGNVLDDITIYTPPTCTSPNNLTASNITLTSADVSWTATGTESQWTIEYKKISESTWTSVSNINTTSYTISNLVASTSYDVRVKAVCSVSDESSWSNSYTFNTACGVYTDFPFTESFDGTTFSPNCWTIAHTAGTSTNTWIRSTSTVHLGAGSAQLQDQQLGNKNNLVTPQFDIPAANSYRVNFWIYRSSYSTLMANEGVKVWTNSTPDTIGGTPLIHIRRDYRSSPVVSAIGWYEYSAVIPNAGLQYIIFEGISEYGTSTYMDDITVEMIPACFIPTNLTTSNIGPNSADISWTAGRSETSWQLDYKLATDLVWTSVTVNTVPTYSITGLTDNTNYIVRVKAICSSEDESDWIQSTFTTTLIPAVVPYSFGFENSTENNNWILVNNSSGNNWYIGSATNNGGTNALYISNDNGVSNSYSNGSSAVVWAYRDVYFTPSNEDYTLKFDWKTYGESTYDYINVYIGSPANVTASTSITVPNGAVLLNSSYLNLQSNWVTTTYSLSADTYSGTIQRIYFLWINDGSGGSNPPAAIDNIKIYSVVDNEIELTNFVPIYDACDLSNVPVTITVKNNGANPITAFTANYQINDGTIISETIDLSSNPLIRRGEYDYTFTAFANFVGLSNTINIWVDYANDFLPNNNSMSLSGIDLITPVAVPYAEDFTNVTVGQDGWRAYDLNNDDITWTKTSGKLQYTYSDTLTANDWVMTPCINIPAGKYEVAYSYNAMSVMPESFSVYMGMGPTVADMTTLFASHPNIVKTATDVTYRDTIIIGNDGIYFFGINATSLAGNLGITIDNFSVTPMIDLNVTAGPNGSIVPSGIITVPLNSTPLFGIYPNSGFHIKGIFVDGTMVRDEDMQNSRFEFYNYGPVDHAADINVTFEVSQYDIIASASNYHNIDYFGNGTIAGTITPMDTTVVEFGYTQDYIITPAEHYHLYSFLVDGQESIGNVADLGDGTFKYNTGRVYATHTLEAIFKLDTVAIIYNVYSGQGTADGMYADATVSSPVVRYTYIDYNSDHLSTILPATGYRTESVSVNGAPMAGIVDYQFVNVIATQIVDIRFVLDSYTITTAAYGNGTITPGTTVTYDPAYTYTYEVTPATGYHIASILVNGQPITVADPAYYTATLTDIHQDYQIEASFAINTYTIEAIAGAHGSINPNGTTTYNWGTTSTYNVIADLGYYISAVTVDGVTTNYTQADNMTTWSNTFANIQSDHTVSVAFTQFTYTITATAGANGTVTPSGVTTLPYGGSQLYTIAPATGYEIAAVTVDGVDMGAITQYTFADVTANHTIGVTFTQLQYTIDAVANVGGSITPSGTAVYNYGANITYNATANTGYTISTVTVDGVVTNVNAATWSETFNNITADHSIYVAFEINTYTVTVNQATNGSIVPGTQIVNYGATPLFTITPSVGYTVSTVLVNGVGVSFTTDASGVATYTFPAVAADQTLTATFAVKTLTIQASSNGNGTITPAGTTTLNYGASQTYNITPATGYQIADVTVDNMSIGAVNTYMFSNVTTNHTIVAQFAMIPCEVPSYLYATNITQDSVTLNWSNTGADSYTIRYKTLDTADYTEIPGITANSFVLNDLTSGTYYVWTVKAVCDINESEWAVQSSFTTEAAPIIGINEAVLSTVKVYSNLNNVYIVNNNKVAIKQVEIFDMFGRVVYVGTADNNPEVISLMVSNGTYVVRLATKEGVATYKVNITR